MTAHVTQAKETSSICYSSTAMNYKVQNTSKFQSTNFAFHLTSFEHFMTLFYGLQENTGQKTDSYLLIE